MPKWEWVYSNPGCLIGGKRYTLTELMHEFVNLKEEKKNLEDVLKSIQEDGTVEHNNAIKLRQENVELKGELETIELEFNLVLEINNDLNKKLIGLNHLKTENVELIERIKKLEEDILKYKNSNINWGRLYDSASKDRTDLENKLDFEQKKYQILDHNYQGCAKYRDEYKHQLNAANKEIEALRSKLRDYQDKYAKSFSYNDMNGLQNKIDELTLMYKERDTKLKTYNGTLLGQILLKEENEKLNLQIVALHKIIEGAKKTIDEQKHPMYPIHWGGYDKNIKEFVESELNNEDPVEGISELLQKAKDLTEGVEVDLDKSLDEQCDPEILKQAKEQSIEEIVDALKGIKTQGFEDYDPRDFVESEIKNEDSLEEKQVEFNAEELLRRVTEYADYSDSTKSFFNNTFSSIPKSFPNEFQEETTAENLEEKFDKGENCLDYFQPYHCPCGMCKHAREENMEKSWEEAASDLALKVAKLENQVEELIIKHTSDPNYKYFLEHGKWPYSAMNPDGTLKTIPCNISTSDYNSNIKGTI